MGIRTFVYSPLLSTSSKEKKKNHYFCGNTAFLNLKIVQKPNFNIFLSFPSRYLKLHVKEFFVAIHTFLIKVKIYLSPLENTAVLLTSKLL